MGIFYTRTDFYMTEVLVILFDLLGTVAFAISGALVGIDKKMDL